MEKSNYNNQPALLIMDMQEPMVKGLADSSLLIKQMNKAIQFARDNEIQVIYVTVGFRKGYPEMSPANKSYPALKSGAMSLDTEASYKVHDAVAPQAGDIIVTKKRISAFTGSDLEVVLRGMQVRHLVLTGIATSGVVLSTIREAADKDYVLTVLSDCCGDKDEEVHRVLTGKVFPRQANVMTSEEWIKKISGSN